MSFLMHVYNVVCIYDACVRTLYRFCMISKLELTIASRQLPPITESNDVEACYMIGAIYKQFFTLHIINSRNSV